MADISPLKAQFDMNTRWYNNVLAGISDTDAHMRIQGLNHIKWIAGHLLNSRLTFMSRITGLQPDDSYKTLFARGSAIGAEAAYPHVNDIVARWNDISAALSPRIMHIPAEVLSTQSPTPAPIDDGTMLGALAFLMSHEAFHIGQMSLLRKLAGKEAMSYR